MSREERRRRWGILQTFVIGRQGNPMMKRVRVIQTPIGGIYLHFIYREDLDPIPHDHPWNFWRMVLKGEYEEEYYESPQVQDKPQVRLIRPLRPSRVPTTAAHRITWTKPSTVSLVIVGRKIRTWGFWDAVSPISQEAARRVADSFDLPREMVVETRRWVDYRDALGLRPIEGVVGDGLADDTAAIQAAIDEGRVP